MPVDLTRNHSLDLLPHPAGPSSGNRRSVRIGSCQVSVTPVFFAYWRFAAERQSIFFRRLQSSGAARFTEDPVLAQFKFTNAYRASDRVSQYLIRNVIYRDDLPGDERNLFFRILLFKLFNRIDTWEYLEALHGPLVCEEFDSERMATSLSERMRTGERVYSAAYIMPSAGSSFGCTYKHENHLRLLDYLLARDFPGRLTDCNSMKDAYELLLSVPSLGPFLAYQFVTDLNYSPLTSFTEAEFVVAGPGAIDGIAKCFMGADRDCPPSEIIDYMYEHQEQHFSEQNLVFRDLWGRPLQLIDCQNIFCEISKYARVAFPECSGASGRTRIKQRFVASPDLPDPWYPPDWGLNEKIQAQLS
jgi:hypothetical protein